MTVGPLTVFTGCSFVEGVGLNNTRSSDDLWVNLFFNSSPKLRETALLNLGQGGNSNQEIFLQSLGALTNHDCKNLFVCWTSLYRYRFHLGVELYPVDQYWAPAHTLTDIMVNPDLIYTAKFLKEIRDKFISLHHDHYEIVKILKYATVINQLGQRLGTNVYFINNILPWDRGYFDQIIADYRLPSHTTVYTQSLLNADTRDDEEFFMIYDKAHLEYQQTRALSECKWLNLDLAFKPYFVQDFGNDQVHPGPLSNNKFSDYLVESFEKIHSGQCVGN